MSNIVLVVRDEQFDALRHQATLDFRRRLERHLIQALGPSEASRSISAISKQISIGISRCAPFGISRERDVARYIEIVCRHMGGFSQTPHEMDALNILYRYGVSAEEKLDQLEALVTKQR